MNIKIKYALFVVTLFLVVTSLCFGQSPDSTTVALQEEKGTPIRFETLAVLSADTKAIVTGGVTETKGKFTVKAPVPGTYFLRVSAIGFTQL